MKWIALTDSMPPYAPLTDQYGRKTETSILLFYPSRFYDLSFPGHCVDVSNRPYVRNGNAQRQGATHWMEIPEPPIEQPRLETSVVPGFTDVVQCKHCRYLNQPDMVQHNRCSNCGEPL